MNWSDPEIVFPMVGIVLVSLLFAPFFGVLAALPPLTPLARLLESAAPNVGVALAVVYGVQRVTR